MKKLLLLIPIIFFACERIDYGEVETYTVKEGEHYSDFPLLQGKGDIYVQVFFPESCRYDSQPPGMSGWNKLIGLMPGYNDVHKNSARWVWRYNYNTGEIDLATYTYVRGERIIIYQMSRPIGTWVEIYVGYDKKLTKWVYEVRGAALGGWIRCPEFKDKNFWWLGLYFGGNSVAPHDITVYYKFEDK